MMWSNDPHLVIFLENFDYGDLMILMSWLASVPVKSLKVSSFLGVFAISWSSSLLLATSEELGLYPRHSLRTFLIQST